MSEMMLEGVRLVDAGGSVAGMTAASVLAEAGADVVLIEPPGGLGCRAEPGFRTWNRSKRSLELDLDDPGDLERLHALLGDADVFLHSFGPSQAAERGLDDDSLASRHRQLIVSSVLAWPANHERADDPLDDHLLLARLGVCDEQQGRRPGPIFVRAPLGTLTATWLAVCGVVARLVARQRTGTAGPAHTSLAQGALIPMMMHWSRAETPSDALRIGMPKDNMRAMLFECADGRWLHVMPPPPDQTPLMKEAMDELGAEAVDAANQAFGEAPGLPNWGANQEAYLRRSADEWLRNHWAHDIPAQEAAPFGAILADEQAKANDYVIEIDDPDEGRTAVPGHPLTLDPPMQVRRAAPAPGQGGNDAASEWSTSRPPPHVTEDGRPPACGLLAGIRVLDFGNFLAGPLGPMLLADLGATVVKVEPATGDPMRYLDWPFAGCQRGKRSVALDLKNPATRPALEALLRWADVVHHNLRRPAATRLGLDAASVRRLNPDVVFCHVSSYGPAGPRADWRGYDQLFQASCGWEVLGAGEGNPPMWHRFGFMDHLCGMSSAAAVLIALYARDREGRATDVAASLLGAGVLTNAETYLRADGTPVPVPTLDGDQTTLLPGVRILEADGGWVAVAARTPEELDSLLSTVGVSSPDELPAAARSQRVDSLAEELAAAGVPSTVVRTDQREPFFDDPANIAAGMVAAYPHDDWGHFEQPGAPWYLGDESVPSELAPPGLGAHTVDVLLEIGLDRADIDELIGSGAAFAGT